MLLVAEVAGGILTGSLALAADGGPIWTVTSGFVSLSAHAETPGGTMRTRRL